MRVVGGRLKGRNIASPSSRDIRPTADRLREAVFNTIVHAHGDPLAGGRVLDLFAGTGALGIEALSRGAVFALFVDRSLTAGRLIETNLRASLSCPAAAFARLDLAATTNLTPLRAGLDPDLPFDLVFLDPPYRQHLAERLLPLLEPAGLLAPGALVVVEEHARVDLPAQSGLLALVDQRRYGETGLWLYRPRPAGT